ncbi:Citrinin biosynthesis transcriptional activator ctnR like protein [Verticillium longisporum]|uniref:Citrinin biosynthesis transcriptional activator ctnR like protein n=1 Tax=Verticillium longisporum TaxID=100787 RepID=A0A8I3A2N4_VERLO|nr:Citrinin biosynthesis transcriptional activator ctnR like protein [Verticillium longisporum]
MICRKRKLKCDGIKPSCSTCTRLGHSCAYDEVRRKSGPKRGYVKALEERLKQVETLLNKTKDSTTGADTNAAAPLNLDTASATRVQLPPAAAGDGFSGQNATLTLPGDRDMDRWQFAGESPQPGPPMDDFNFNASMNPGLNPNMPMGMGNLNNTNFPWEMIGLGLEEPLPPQETIDELHQIYFEKVHPSLPMIHKYRYLAAMNLAWMNTGAAVRLCQMIGLHRLDGAGLDVKQCLPPPRDWTEREERRRTFWMAFCEDRYASIGTGWPMTIDEKDIMTNLPSSDEAFDMSRPEQTQSLQDSMSPAGASELSSFGGIVLMACLFGRNLIHLHRPDVDDRDNDLNGEFWKRHRSMDNIILNTSLCLPPHIKLPSGLSNPNIVFTNMSIHTSTICLHQAAIFKADKNKLPASVSAESKVRCITAANEIASIMRMISHMDLSCMNPFIAFCLYVAARVFVQYLKSRPDDSQTADSLRFLLSAMNALKRRNPLTESFLVQLDVDLEALGMRIPKLRAAFPRSGDSPDATAAGKRCDEEGASGILAYRNDCNYTNGDDAVPVTAPGIVEPVSGTQPVSRTISDSSGFSGQRWLGPDAGFAQEGGASRVPLQGMVLTPGSGARFQMGDSPVDAYGMASNGWPGMPGQTGMTPMSEGVLRSLMNMGPMDAMDLSSWDSGA